MLIDYINRIKLPFEPSVMAQAAAYAALVRQRIYGQDPGEQSGRNGISREESESTWYQTGPNSWANFILIELGSEEKVSKHQ